ncbi:MAG: hypothetical protein OEZ11_01295 [Gammaproteobacteria bacterium]|nr:hypothetical protein [Gammaproteobacteria bacterium]
MRIRKGTLFTCLGAVAIAATGLTSTAAYAQNDNAARRQAVIDYWTAERRADAEPRDLRIDHRGLGYLRRADGSLTPYGHQVAATNNGRPTTNAKPVDDTEPPQISNLDPAANDTIGDSHTFSATVTDNVGLRSVTFIITYPTGTTDSFAASNTSGDTWSLTLSGFTDGNWSWRVEATDTGKRGGNTAVSANTPFVVNGGGTGNGDTVTNAQWTGGGDIQLSAGRLFYEMPTNPRRKRWAGYVCSGTVVTDGATGRSVILTASHCVYDDANGSFARNVLFIPDQAGTTGSGTDSNCSNDPIGCWVAAYGVVDANWTTSTFPDNIPWDYGFYVVDDDPSSHSPGLNASSETLDVATQQFTIDFSAPSVDDGIAGAASPDFTHGMGYSYSDDPNFMFCAEDMTTEGTDNWWIPSCGLSGGSSGGPWIQPMGNGAGPVISVNSWGYTTSPGMAGPKLNGTSAFCVYDAAANTTTFLVNPADGDAGYAITCN